MATTALTLNSHSIRFTSSHRYLNTHSRLSPPSIVSTPQRQSKRGPSSSIFTSHRVQRRSRLFFPIVNQIGEEPGKETTDEEEEVNSAGVKAALSMLRFYKSEISPLLPRSCRYVPSCSEYSMIAYKKYGVVKGTILTAWRLCRCNPLGGSGFDPPRWFDEKRPSEQ